MAEKASGESVVAGHGRHPQPEERDKGGTYLGKEEERGHSSARPQVLMRRPSERRGEARLSLQSSIFLDRRPCADCSHSQQAPPRVPFPTTAT